MRQILIGLGALLCSASLAVADPAEGLWQTEVDDGAFAHVRLSACGGAICGTIERTFDASGEYQSPNVGKQIVIDMEPIGGGAYEGSVWRPSHDKVYIGKMTLEGDGLILRGCVAGGLFCASQGWARIGD